MAQLSASGPRSGSHAESRDLVRAVAHDLRSPLCSLRGFLRLLERDNGMQLDERGRGYVDRISATLDRMETLVEELVSLEPSQTRGCRRRWIETRELCLQLAADLKPVLDEQGTRLIVPEAPPPVYAVRTQLVRVISNLVSNAIRHMGRSPDPWIRIEFLAVERGVELRVSDNGRGIPPSMRERILEPPHHPPALDGSIPSGLGLAIVRQIAEEHGGWVRLDSPPGLGATFRVFFPGARP